MTSQIRRIMAAAALAALSLVAWRRRPVRHPEPAGSWSPLSRDPVDP
jgi:hypothetical protein